MEREETLEDIESLEDVDVDLDIDLQSEGVHSCSQLTQFANIAYYIIKSIQSNEKGKKSFLSYASFELKTQIDIEKAYLERSFLAVSAAFSLSFFSLSILESVSL